MESNLPLYALGIVLFALGICVSIALHEAGHMMTAKWFGMKVRRYFVGFGPTLFSFRRGETEYGLKAVPLGGFCDIAGMTALDDIKPDENSRAMWRYKTWKRTVVLAAGSFTHFIIGFIVLYILAVSLGLPNIDGKAQVGALTCAKGATTTEELRTLSCEPGDPQPAKDSGVLPGDVITAVEGKPVADWSEAQEAIQRREGTVQLTVDRDGEAVPLEIEVIQVALPNAADAESGEETTGTRQIGMIGIKVEGKFEYGPGAAVPATVAFTGEMFEHTWQALMRFPERMPKVVEAIFGGERDPDTPVSVVGASIIGGEAAERGLWDVFLLVLAMLNFFVGVFNLLPLLPLDGGHIAITWYERVRDWFRQLRGKAAGGPVDYTKLSAVTMVVVIIGGAVVLLTVTADIVNPIHLPQ
ncbi:MAG: PDZ domain-containing protein [Actinophytocola sp.]|nr:PDZ domain-containing protein [Actinophytocola sp.]